MRFVYVQEATIWKQVFIYVNFCEFFVLQSLLAQPEWRNKIDGTDEKGMRPLHAAAEIDNCEAFQLLLDRGGHVHWWRTGHHNHSDRPIHIAAFNC